MIYCYTPDDSSTCGGVRKIYRHVDVLNRNGFSARVLHTKPGFRCTWFQNDTPVVYTESTQLTPADYLVVPEIWGPRMARLAPGIKKVILNQNGYLTFRGYTLDKNDRETPYLSPEVVATITVSEDSVRYLQYVFPQHRVLRMHYAIDQSMFYPVSTKRKQIAVMPRKNPDDLLQVVSMLKLRGVLSDFDILPIQNMSHEQAAAALRDSAIFLSFSSIEGFGLPPAEAMACGCITIGYHGRGGKEFFRPEFSYPIEFGDIEGYARTVEAVLNQFRIDPTPLWNQAALASQYIRQHYSEQVEEADIVQCWKTITAQR